MLSVNKLEVGTVLENRYQLVKLLGQGGFADIWEIQDLTDRQGEHRVLKILQRGNMQSIQRLRQEFRLLRELEHDYIVKAESLYPATEPTEADYFLHCHFFVMEKIAGINLEELLKSRSHCTYLQIADWIEQIATTLQYLHTQNIVHGDLKPANIMITANHTIKLIDFGAAKKIDTRDLDKYREYIDRFDRKTLTRIYTPEYAAPEQRAGQMGFRSDFYSFGRTIMFALTGQHPSTIATNRQAPIPSLLRDFLNRTTQEDPLERHTDSQSLLVHACRVARSLRKQFAPWAVARQIVTVIGAAAISTLSSLGMRALGTLQTLEFAAYDQMVRMRPVSQIESPILIIAIRDQQSISDRDLAKVITHLFPDQTADHPSLVSIGIKRDEYVDHTGQQELENLFEKHTNLFGSCEYDAGNSQGFNFIPTPSTPLGFGNNLFYQSPEEVRRIHLLMYRETPSDTSGCTAQVSHSLLLAHYYLYNSYPQPQRDRLFTNSQTHQTDNSSTTYNLGMAQLPNLKTGQGAFQGSSVDPFPNSWQILLDYHGLAAPLKESFANVLKRRLSPEIVRNKIILIGRDDRGLSNYKDLTQATPYGAMSAIELRSQMVGQLISVAQGKRPVLRPASYTTDMLWILAIAILSGLGCWRMTNFFGQMVLIIILPIALYGGCFLILFTQGLWLGFVPMAIASTSTMLIVAKGTEK
jgi:CHASE2 domain-containing sensor protein/tRNA A-37 threonylcarbamoyl transferase component Bud32